MSAVATWASARALASTPLSRHVRRNFIFRFRYMFCELVRSRKNFSSIAVSACGRNSVMARPRTVRAEWFARSTRRNYKTDGGGENTLSLPALFLPLPSMGYPFPRFLYTFPLICAVPVPGCSLIEAIWRNRSIYRTIIEYFLVPQEYENYGISLEINFLLAIKADAYHTRGNFVSFQNDNFATTFRRDSRESTVRKFLGKAPRGERSRYIGAGRFYTIEYRAQRGLWRFGSRGITSEYYLGYAMGWERERGRIGVLFSIRKSQLEFAQPASAREGDR